MSSQTTADPLTSVLTASAANARTFAATTPAERADALDAVAAALAAAGASEGVFALIEGVEEGVAALQGRRIRAVTFTGSLRSGRYLFDLACARDEPIPFYGELGSTNPVVVTPDAWRERASEVVKGAGRFLPPLTMLEKTAMPTLDRHDDVFVLDLGDTENRFHPDWLSAVNTALDQVEGADGPRALVTAATGKFFSNGLDLDWLFAHPDKHENYVNDVHALLARMLTLPMITVAALQGHTFAAGAMLSLVHDLLVMRADRGFWCLPEADINIPFTRGMSALIQARLAPHTAHEAMTTARRYGGGDALAASIVDRAVDVDSVRSTALELAAAHAGKAGTTLATIKARMYAPVLNLLRDRTDPLS